MATTKKQSEIDDMAMRVYSLMRQGLNKRQIAKYLGMSDRQVYRYLDRAKNLFRWLADNIDGKMHLGETLAAFQEQERIALANAAACSPETNVAVGWLNTAQAARREIKKLLQECGAVFKMPESVEVSDGLDFEDAETRKEYVAWRMKAQAKRRKDKGDGS